MRILFWNGPFLPRIGGVEIFTARLAEGLIARGHQVRVLANGPQGTDPEIIPGLEVIRLPLLEAVNPQSPDPRVKLRLIAQVTAEAGALKRQFQPDLVHVNLTDAGPFFHLRTLQAHPAATVVTFQAALERPVTPESVTGALVSGAQALVAVSGPAADNAAEFTGQPKDNIQVIYPGVPAGEFAPGPRSKDASRPALFGFIGRLVEEKGVQVMLRALARVDDIRLRIIGDGAYRGALDHLAATLGVTDRVEFCGHVSDVERRRLMAECDGLIVPSLHLELFGMAAVEGGLSGLPVIASAIGGLQEIVIPGQTGQLFAPGDDTALAGHMRSLAEDGGMADRMGTEGRKRALALFTVGSTIDRYETLYDSLMLAETAAG